MTAPLPELARWRYPGRAILIGRDRENAHSVVVYILTGRSASSQARKLEREGDILWVRPTDRNLLEKGNADLLIYPAIILSGYLSVSNGRQTASLASLCAAGYGPEAMLEEALSSWEYEPDAPIFTPRISGCVLGDGRAALHIIRRSREGACERSVFPLAPAPGSGWLLPTYQGSDRDPILPYQGKPVSVSVPAVPPPDMAEAVYESLRPPSGEKDYRIGVATVYFRLGHPEDYALHIINRHERKVHEGRIP